ncbi:amino acid/amide ABC transporter ATP-binding protein 1 (HAAT family) [Paracoccus pantotrophus]|uniref:ABC transporter ATP-binding protein n=1 Tax=Paracoccus pantotrophus TaxID=82367 RepID=A0AAE6NTK9_PARPN|nr:ABC transporter ATP-binding protein [Paracoccus pantotrophus]QFG36186.1 ABC transporter ATP-binding protein [Paracoccus pantotrophus]RKS43242.1 amino acid/amide ABC transporter ATP-binding protein 1 (HAAT family) [Paracoccus pantotrophus]
MTDLVLEHVHKNFGGVIAAKDVSMRVPAGRITGLIGPNGAGKTTLINLITGMLSLSSGKVLFGDRDISAEPADKVARAGMGRTFQNIRLQKEASVLANVMVGFHRHETCSLIAAILGLPSSRREDALLRQRAMALLGRFGMAGHADSPAGSLAYGHQRKVEMMRALATDPELILLDEPVAGMNDVEALQLGRIFRELADEGKAILLIEHNMRFVQELCDHVHVLDGGRLIAEGKPREVVADPAVITAYLGEE